MVFFFVFSLLLVSYSVFFSSLCVFSVFSSCLFPIRFSSRLYVFFFRFFFGFPIVLAKLSVFFHFFRLFDICLFCLLFGFVPIFHFICFRRYVTHARNTTRGHIVAREKWGWHVEILIDGSTIQKWRPMFRICRSRAFDYFLGIHFVSPVILSYPFFSLFLIIRHLFVLLVIRFFSLFFTLFAFAGMLPTRGIPQVYSNAGKMRLACWDIDRCKYDPERRPMFRISRSRAFDYFWGILLLRCFGYFSLFLMSLRVLCRVEWRSSVDTSQRSQSAEIKCKMKWKSRGQNKIMMS